MPIQGGYYIKARCIDESWISHAQPIIREIWDYLLREANHEDKKYNGFIVKRGQLFRSYREIREALSWKIGYRKMMYHESSTKRAMKALMTELMIELTSEPRGNLITVLNYDYYQDPKNYERTDDRTDDRTNGEPMANQCRTPINKNEKNIRTKERNIKREIFELPDWIPQETWNAYLELRLKKKAAKTPYALNLIISSLLKIQTEHEHNPVEVLNQSIKSGWIDVYPLKNNQKQNIIPLSKTEERTLRNAQRLQAWVNKGELNGQG